MKSLWIVQPYVPSYRVPFFEGLQSVLEQRDIELNVVAGAPQGDQALRADAVEPTWLRRVTPRTRPLLGRTITLTYSGKFWRKGDAVIVPHMGSSLDALLATFGSGRRIRVGVWGHIASYTDVPHPLDAAVERLQLRRADHVFAYTPGGAKFAHECGVEPAKTTVVMNSIDVSALSNSLANVSATDAASFRNAYSIASSPYVTFIGGLDTSKRVDFLSKVAEELERRESLVRIVVGGTGSEGHLLDKMSRTGRVVRLGRVSDEVKAVLLSEAKAIVNPGRIGLIAVDALAAGRKIITTDFKFHAPENEYLIEGISRTTISNGVVAFADAIELTLDGSGHFEPPEDFPNLELMIANFAGGVSRLVEA